MNHIHDEGNPHGDARHGMSPEHRYIGRINPCNRNTGRHDIQIKRRFFHNLWWYTKPFAESLMKDNHHSPCDSTEHRMKDYTNGVHFINFIRALGSQILSNQNGGCRTHNNEQKQDDIDNLVRIGYRCHRCFCILTKHELVHIAQ